jgi:membrane-associated protease RseP (regulator of RpoE activity)
MDNYSTPDRRDDEEIGGQGTGYVFVQVVPDPPDRPVPPPPLAPRPRVLVPLALFILTCFSTLLAGISDDTDHWTLFVQWWVRGNVGMALADLGAAIGHGLAYAGPVMLILVCHEAGHFFQARRYGVHTSFPYFIPMPISPIGTMGAVISMDAHVGDRKALFDIGISGPLAGLIPTLIFCTVGVMCSKIGPAGLNDGPQLNVPWVFQWIENAFFPNIPAGHGIYLHPMAFAGWVGLLVTALNLFPIGQLDGGHVLYGLLRRNAYPVARIIFYGAFAAVLIGVFVFGKQALLGWLLMLFLLSFMGPEHPPTADDNVPLGFWRYVLGWLTLAFLPFGFTAIPMGM